MKLLNDDSDDIDLREQVEIREVSIVSTQTIHTEAIIRGQRNQKVKVNGCQ